MISRLFLEKLASRLKGRTFEIDSGIDDLYLAQYAVGRLLMALRGRILFRRAGSIFIGRRVSIRHKRGLHYGRGVVLADGVYVDAMSTSGVNLGNYVSIGKNTRIECTGTISHVGVGLVADDHAGLGTDCFYGAAGGIRIGRDTIVGNFVTFHSENHVTTSLDIPIHSQGVTHSGIAIGADCWLGAKVTVLDGVVLGDGAVVAAGAVMTSGVYPGKRFYGGVPAREIGRR